MTSSASQPGAPSRGMPMARSASRMSGTCGREVVGALLDDVGPLGQPVRLVGGHQVDPPLRPPVVVPAGDEVGGAVGGDEGGDHVEEAAQRVGRGLVGGAALVGYAEEGAEVQRGGVQEHEAVRHAPESSRPRRPRPRGEPSRFACSRRTTLRAWKTSIVASSTSSPRTAGSASPTSARPSACPPPPCTSGCAGSSSAASSRATRPSSTTPALGQQMTAFISITPLDPAAPDDIPERLHAVPQIEECHSVAGDENYILKVRVATPRRARGAHRHRPGRRQRLDPHDGGAVDAVGVSGPTRPVRPTCSATSSRGATACCARSTACPSTTPAAR